jgi:hypothetical protein
VNRKIPAPVPEPIAQLQRQLDQFRGSHARRTKLPEPLWQAAAELARTYGVYRVVHTLRLDYTGLKKRLGDAPDRPLKASPPSFVELIAAHPATLQEYAIEFESPSGGRMRVQWKASAPPDWASLLRAWREAER